jgi:hypothetical protein
MSSGWGRGFGRLPRPVCNVLCSDLAHRVFDRNAGSPRDFIYWLRMLKPHTFGFGETAQIPGRILLKPRVRIIRQRKPHALILRRLREQPKNGKRQKNDRSHDEARADPDETRRHVACFMSCRVEAARLHER